MRQRRAGRVFEARRLSLRRASKTRPALQAIDFNRVEYSFTRQLTQPVRQDVAKNAEHTSKAESDKKSLARVYMEPTKANSPGEGGLTKGRFELTMKIERIEENCHGTFVR